MTSKERTEAATTIFERVAPPLMQGLCDGYDLAHGKELPPVYRTAAHSWLWGPRLNDGANLWTANSRQLDEMEDLAKTVGERLPADGDFAEFWQCLDEAIKEHGPTILC